MENRYYVKIRLFDNLPDMPDYRKYITMMIEANSEDEIKMVVDDRHRITMITMVD